MVTGLGFGVAVVVVVRVGVDLVGVFEGVVDRLAVVVVEGVVVVVVLLGAVVVTDVEAAEPPGSPPHAARARHTRDTRGTAYTGRGVIGHPLCPVRRPRIQSGDVARPGAGRPVGQRVAPVVAPLGQRQGRATVGVGCLGRSGRGGTSLVGVSAV